MFFNIPNQSSDLSLLIILKQIACSVFLKLVELFLDLYQSTLLQWISKI